MAVHHWGRECPDWPWCGHSTDELQACADEIETKLRNGQIDDPDGRLTRIAVELRNAIEWRGT